MNSLSRSPRSASTALAALALAVAAGACAPAQAASSTVPSALKLAQHKGCTQCHSVDSARSSLDDSLPVGPSWQEVAARYTGQADAERRLMRTLRQGSNPARTHWRGEVAGRVMPAQGPRLSADEARRLVRWILAL